MLNESLNETRDKDLMDEKSGISIIRQIFPAHHDLFRAPVIQRLQGIINSLVTKAVEEWVLNAPIKRSYSILKTAAETRRFDFENWKTLNNNDRNQDADQRFSLNQWFAAGARSCRFRKTGSGRYYLTIIVVLSNLVPSVLSFKSPLAPERGPWERGCVLSSQTIHASFAVAFRTQVSTRFGTRRIGKSPMHWITQEIFLVLFLWKVIFFTG